MKLVEEVGSLRYLKLKAIAECTMKVSGIDILVSTMSLSLQNIGMQKMLMSCVPITTFRKAISLSSFEVRMPDF